MRFSQAAALAALLGPTLAGRVRAQDPPSGVAVLDRAAAVYSHVTTARGTFEQTVANPLTGTSAVTRGGFEQARPSRLSIKFTDPPDDRIVADGKWVWMYLPSANPGQVVRMPVSDERNAPAGGAVSLDFITQFLTDPTSRFTVLAAGADTVAGHRTSEVQLAARQENDPIPHATLWIDDADGLVRQFEVTDRSGTSRRVRVLSETFNVPLDKSAFVFKPPHGTKVVDQSALVNGSD